MPHRTIMNLILQGSFGLSRLTLKTRQLAIRNTHSGTVQPKRPILPGNFLKFSCPILFLFHHIINSPLRKLSFHTDTAKLSSQVTTYMMDMITSMVAEKPVVIFSKSSCCLSYSIKSLISNFGANATVYELDQISNGQQIERALLDLGCQPSVPAVFIGQQFIGGANRIMSLHLRNELVTLLMNARAIWIWNKK